MIYDQTPYYKNHKNYTIIGYNIVCKSDIQGQST